MSIVVTTPTGHIGSRLAARLLDAGEKITVIARDPQKVASLEKRGAKVVQGSLGDPNLLKEATRGASALFWLTPPNPVAPDFRRYQNDMARSAADAIRANSIPHVVNLSSIGAHLDHGVGPVSGLHDVEKAINSAAANVTHLRPAAFMENFLMSLETIKASGAIFLPIPGKTRGLMIATKDIAEVAAERLLNRTWTGHSVLSLAGPRDLSYEEAAEILTRVLERKISHVQVTPDQTRQALLGMGLSADMVSLYLELYRAFETGFILSGISNTPDVTTQTTFEQFAREVLRPALGA